MSNGPRSIAEAPAGQFQESFASSVVSVCLLERWKPITAKLLFCSPLGQSVSVGLTRNGELTLPGKAGKKKKDDDDSFCLTCYATTDSSQSKWGKKWLDSLGKQRQEAKDLYPSFLLSPPPSLPLPDCRNGVKFPCSVRAKTPAWSQRNNNRWLCHWVAREINFEMYNIRGVKT